MTGTNPQTKSATSEEARAMDRLRANLAAAGIPVTSEDLERVEADGTLRRVVEIRRVLSAVEAGAEPDALAAWGPFQDATGGARVHEEPEPAPSTDHDAPRGELPTTISELAELLRHREVSPVEVTERTLSAIEASGARLNLFQTLLPERAIERAREAEREIGKGGHRGPLHGVPVAIKDLLEMSGTITTAGSKVRADSMSDFDAAAVERLEAAGAIILGKTRMSEFAYWPGSTNPHYGPTRNPHDPSRDAGGSSSGSAAAVASGCVYAALGTDTGGSIRIPAALCGVVGLKPTFGRTSLHGCVPLAWSLDHLGPLTRTVDDAAIVLAALAGQDARDPRTRPFSDFPFGSTAVGAAGLPTSADGSLAGVRIGVLVSDGEPEALGAPETLRAWAASNEVLRDAGASLVPVELLDMSILWKVSSLTLGVEAAAYHASSLRTRFDDYGRFCRGRLVGAFAYGFDDMILAQRIRGRIRNEWRALWDRCDVLSTPSQPDVAPELGLAASTRFTNPFNALGWPAVSVPFGTGRLGLPVGTQIVGPAWDEASVLSVARVLEYG